MFEPVGNKAFLLDPSAVLEEMRTKNPVYRYEKSAVPIVNIFGYHDIRAVLRDVDSFSNTLTGAQQDKASTDPYNLLGMDPPRHRDMREVVKNVFTPGMVRSLEPVIRSHANQIMDTVLDMGEFDAVEDFGAQLSVHLICQLIGVPEDEKPLIREWTREASELGFDLLWHEQTNPDYEQRIAASMQTMHDYFAEKIDDRLRQPGNDVLTQIARSGLSREESVSFARLMLVAGNETTTNLINHILRLLVVHPEQQARLRRQPELASSTMVETLRYAPAIRGTFREARVSTELHGVSINPGEIVWAWIYSANRDPALCEDPQRFDITRQPPNNLAFGHGIHTCLGISLAKMEALTMLQVVLERTREIEPLSDALDPINSLLSNGFEHQPLRFHT